MIYSWWRRKCHLSEYNPNNGMITVMVSNYGDSVWRESSKGREQLYSKP
ncbi:MAG: hypothetical protein K2I96_22785 [Lachnospiraceae bacterium]|nr:hypothetical protein [Lachnospiraceae bacterium]